MLLVAGTLVYLHLFKLVSFMQSRLGPMEAGPFGSLQLLAEVGKFLQKEDIFPRKADRFVFAAPRSSCSCRRSCWSSSCPAVPMPGS